MHTGAYRSQKELLEPLELELHVIISFLTWVLGTKLKNMQEQHGTISLAPILSFFIILSDNTKNHFIDKCEGLLCET